MLIRLKRWLENILFPGRKLEIIRLESQRLGNQINQLLALRVEVSNLAAQLHGMAVLRPAVRQLEEQVTRIGAIQLAHIHPNPLLGVPAEITRPNLAFACAYKPKRSGMEVRYLDNLFSVSQPDCVWHEGKSETGSAVLLREHTELQRGDILTVTEDVPYDLSVGTVMVKVFHHRTEKFGYISLETLIGETAPTTDELWAAADIPALRNVVEAQCDSFTLYSTNRVSPLETETSIKYLSRFENPEFNFEQEVNNVHPLEAGAHANRLGVWALHAGRSATEKARATKLIVAMLERYALPAMRPIAPGAYGWPYSFDFKMPWKTALKSPWYSGYANAAMCSAAACAFRLTEDTKYRDAARSGLGFLRLSASQGGALYWSEGYMYVAEYAYSTPPIPNYRVLDGEICTLIYLHTAAVLMRDPDLLDFAIRLEPGLIAMLDLLCAPDGLPQFGMDGQPMNPNYMWQLWVALQQLANIFKERRFTEYAGVWASAIPASFRQDGFPL